MKINLLDSGYVNAVFIPDEYATNENIKELYEVLVQQKGYGVDYAGMMQVVLPINEWINKLEVLL